MRRLMGALVMLASGCGRACIVPSGAGCAASAEAAVARMLGVDSAASAAAGFRVVAITKDALRGTSWAVVESCADRARPRVAFELPTDKRDRVMQETLVRIGERVSVVSDQSDSRTRVAGWVEESGGEGALVRVRLRPVSGDDSTVSPVIRCRVVRAGLVEVVR